MNRTTYATSENATVWRPDVTVASIVPQSGRFLLVEENVRGELVLNQPAGHLEPNESLPAQRAQTLEDRLERRAPI